MSDESMQSYAATTPGYDPESTKIDPRADLLHRQQGKESSSKPVALGMKAEGTSPVSNTAPTAREVCYEPEELLACLRSIAQTGFPP